MRDAAEITVKIEDMTTPIDGLEIEKIAITDSIIMITDETTAEIINIEIIIDTDIDQYHLSRLKKCSVATIAQTRTIQLTGTAPSAKTAHTIPGIVKNIV